MINTKEKYAEILRSSDYIRGENGLWINAQAFRQEARNYLKNGYYCPYPVETPDWIDYWDVQLKRCINGYETGGSRITGHHYFYLNFCQIKIEMDGVKKISFPDFWDGDYNYFWALDIARNGISLEDYNSLHLDVKIQPQHLDGNRHLMVGKSRRKGYSFKNAAVCVNVYNTIPEALTLITAFDGKYSEDTMDKTLKFLNFLNKGTGWGKSRLKDTQKEVISGWVETNELGVKVIQGYESVLEALTFQDNPDAARGKDAHTILMEEMGTFANAIDSFHATEPSTKAGDIKTGQMIMFGTGGDMDKGTVDFNEMFYDPETYDILPFMNIWDEGAESTSCAFFHPVYWNKERYYDKQGNSDIEGATESEKNNRKKKNTSKALRKYTTEYPFTPEEAFQSSTANIFPTIELTARKNKVKTHKLHLKKGQPVNIYFEKGEVKVEPILGQMDRDVIWNYPVQTDDLRGVPVIYEYPTQNPPFGFYKIGYDPYAQDQSTGNSLGSIYVYKGAMLGEYTKNKVVANYNGRPESTETMNRVSLLFAELYNTHVMHENMFQHVSNYFKKKRKLNRLSGQPDDVISKHIKKSKVSRIWGCHMDDRLKDAGEAYINEWLMTVQDYDEDGNEITNLDILDDLGLIEEFIKYNRKGNFDRVMAFMMIMFQDQQDVLDHVTYKKTADQQESELLSVMKSLYNKK